MPKSNKVRMKLESLENRETPDVSGVLMVADPVQTAPPVPPPDCPPDFSWMEIPDRPIPH